MALSLVSQKFFEISFAELYHDGSCDGFGKTQLP